MNLKEHAHSILRVDGRMSARHTRDAAKGTFSAQLWIATREHPTEPGHLVKVELRFDDQCGNGHNTFSVTGDVYDPKICRGDKTVRCGQVRDDIAQAFPELIPLLKWHLVSTDGPMHYIANTVYLAGDRDHNGLRAGETRQVRNGKTGELCWIREGALTEYADGPVRPAGERVLVWTPLMRVGEGKKRELDAAREVAVWPDATDADLCAEPAELEQRLRDRLPWLIADFEVAMTCICGFELRAE